MFLASVDLGEPNDQGEAELRNTSDVPFTLERQTRGETQTVTLPAQGAMKVRTGRRAALKATVTNLLVAPGKGLAVSLNIGPRNR